MIDRRFLPAKFLISSSLLLAAAAGAVFAAQPVERPTYGPDEAVPKHLTPQEQRWIELHPIVAPDRGVTPPPGGDLIRATAEYEPVHGICLSWKGTTGWKTILQQMAAHITTSGEAFAYVAVSNSSELSQAQSAIAGAGADMSRVRFMVRTTDTIWIRDYGPRYIYQGNVRAVIDHTYNRPRPNDNAYNQWFAQQLNHAYYELPLVHGGGNYHLNSQYEGFATNLIMAENPSLTSSQIVGIWSDYQGIDTQLTAAYPASVDSTQHIDMWLQVTGPRSAVISDWPFESGSIQDQVADGLADQLTAEGWTITRVPARRVSGVHYTYTNVVMCNDIILVPTYTNASVVPLNQQALDAWAAAMPDKTIIPINCQAIVTASGVMHCITMHIPAHLAGAHPTAYLDTLRGGESLDPGDTVEIRWLTDNATPQNMTVSLNLSLDGGTTFSTPIATDIPDTGSYFWTVPDIGTTQGRVQITALNSAGLTGSDASVADIVITGTPACPGDINGDGSVDLADLNLVLANFGSAGPAGDANGDGAVDLADLNIVLANFGCP